LTPRGRFMMREHCFDAAHKARMRDFFQQTRNAGLLFRHKISEELLWRMSEQLRGDTSLLIAEGTLAVVPFLHADTVGERFLGVLSLQMQNCVYAAHESVSVERLTIIRRGIVALKGGLYHKGFALGCDIVIGSHLQQLRDLQPAMTLAFVQTTYITRSGLFAAAQGFPEALAHLKKRGRLLVMRALLWMHVRRVQQQRAKEHLSNLASLSKTHRAMHKAGAGWRKACARNHGARREVLGHSALPRVDLGGLQHSAPTVTLQSLDEKVEQLRASIDSKLEQKLEPVRSQLELLVAGLQAASDRQQGRKSARQTDEAASKDHPGRESFRQRVRVPTTPSSSSAGGRQQQQPLLSSVDQDVSNVVCPGSNEGDRRAQARAQSPLELPLASVCLDA